MATTPAALRVNQEYYSMAWSQFVALCRAEKRPIMRADEHKCGTSACSWILTKGLPEDVTLYFCSQAGTQHLCGPLACVRRSAQNGSEVCRCTGRTLQSMIMSGSAYAADTSGYVARAGVSSTSIIGDASDGPTAPPPPPPPPSSSLSAAGGGVSATDVIANNRIVETIVMMLNSPTARQCRRETIEKRQEDGVKQVASWCIVGQKAVGVTNVALALHKIWIHYLSVFKNMAAPCETAPDALINDLAHNILLMWHKFIVDAETSGVTNFVCSNRRSQPSIQTFTHVCLTLYCSGFNDTEHGFRIKPSATLCRFMIQSPMVTRLSTISGSLVHYVSVLKGCLHASGSSLDLITLRDKYVSA